MDILHQSFKNIIILAVFECVHVYGNEYVCMYAHIPTMAHLVAKAQETITH